MGKKKAASAIYQLKISLRGARPPIWRRVQVPSDITLGDLHQVIQLAMGWYNCHLHEFEVQGQSYGQPMPEYDWDVRDERKTKLNKVVSGEKFKFSYVYDMGDSWEHQILVEKILEPDSDTRYPVCIKGKRACPPEDCGGIWGYGNFLEAIGDPNHPDHGDMVEWIGDEFDPEWFDLEAINRSLQPLR
ncbi:plasmid pRiA4b ORF-3 family protein [Nodosilinea sp. P-1105]|uniref:plasmid pRiA4b ORF-3 family protein n=1 Tax=Nodosilinea sp. P-1105 TaxID=2546229 RepID=UPI00146C42CC|nr:plasmid pRiA4b ORF-3 family protein [Nodosilinea sp. P-1105]NMF85724.1 plasmid pRiA4b ORF-3 family protein [Nodosilinea sp. P-1105]